MMKRLLILLLALCWGLASHGVDLSDLPDTSTDYWTDGATKLNTALNALNAGKVEWRGSVTTAARDLLASPTLGDFVYNTTTAQFEAYNGSSWGGIGGKTAAEIESALDTYYGNTNWRTQDGTGTDDQTAAEVVFTPAGTIAAATAQAAIEELDTEKQAASSNLDIWAGLTPSTDGQAIVLLTYAQMKAAMDLEAGTDFYTIAAADTAFLSPSEVSSIANLTSLLSLTGTAGATTYLRGDGSWATPAGGGGSSLTAAAIPATAQEWATGNLYRGTLDGTALSGAYSLTLPASPTELDKVVGVFEVTNAAITFTIPVADRLLTDSSATNIVFPVGHHEIVFEYIDSEWKVSDTGEFGDLPLTDIADGTANRLFGYDASGVPTEVIVGSELTYDGTTLNAGAGAGVQVVSTTPGSPEAGYTYLIEDIPAYRTYADNGADYYQVSAVFTDVTDPTFGSISLAADGVTYTATANEDLQIGAGGSGGFSATDSSLGAISLTFDSITGNELVLTGDPAVNELTTVTMSYAQPGDGVEDLRERDLASFTDAEVTNGSTQSTYIEYTDFEETGAPTGWSTGGGSPDWDDASNPLAGAESLAITYGDNASFGYADSDEIWVRFKFRTNGSNSTNSYMLAFGGGVSANVRGGPSIRFFHGSSSIDRSVTVDQDYDMWLHMVRGTGSDGVLELYWSTVGDGVRPATPTFSMSNGTGTTAFTAAVFRNENVNNSDTFYFDEVTISELPLGDF